MNYNNMTVEELLLLNSIDVSRFKKEISYDKLRSLRDDLDLYGTYRINSFLVIGKHKIRFGIAIKELSIEKYSVYLKNKGYNLKQINEAFDEIKAKRKELKVITFDVLGADKIGDVYDEVWDNFTGSLGYSCMRGKGSRYYNITTKLEDKEDMKIAVLRNKEGLLQARSLIWCGSYYDKVYANDNALVALMERKLKEAEFGYVGNKQVAISLDKSLYDYEMPYMDNVCYYSENKLELSNYDYGEYELQEVSGEVWNTACANCGDRHKSDMIIIHNGDIICDNCYNDNVICYADDREEYYYSYDLVLLEDTGRYVHVDGDRHRYCADRDCYYSEDYDLFYAEDTGEYYSEDMCLYFTEDTYEWYVNSDNLYFTVDTELYYKYNDDFYYYNGEYYENKPKGYED